MPALLDDGQSQVVAQIRDPELVAVRSERASLRQPLERSEDGRRAGDRRQNAPRRGRPLQVDHQIAADDRALSRAGIERFARSPPSERISVRSARPQRDATRVDGITHPVATQKKAQDLFRESAMAIERLLERGFVTTKLDKLVNWSRSSSVWPLSFGLAYTIAR